MFHSHLGTNPPKKSPLKLSEGFGFSFMFRLALATLAFLAAARLLYSGVTMELAYAEMRTNAARESTPSASLVGAAATPTPSPHSTFPPRRLAWFLHFHKAGGSSFTALADENNETKRIDGGEPHSHLELTDEEFRWEFVGDDDLPESCASRKRERLARGKAGKGAIGRIKSTSFQQELQREMTEGVTFLSTEHWFPDLSEEDNDQNTNISNENNNSTQNINFIDNVRLVAVFREPIERLVSSYYYHNCDGNRCPITRRRRGNGYCNFTDWIGVETNMYTRMLNGVPFGPKKVGRPCSHDLVASAAAQRRNLTRALEKAKRVLRKRFDLVLTLDTLAKRPDVASCALRRTLGWSRTKFPWMNAGHGGRRDARCDKVRAPLNGREKSLAAKANAVDVNLYSFATKAEARILTRLGCIGMEET